MRRPLLVILAAAALLAASVAPSLAAGGTITLIPNGSVDVRTGANGAWVPVTAETTVTAGQEVRTHRTSTAQLAFADGSRVQINNFSIFAIDKTEKDETSFSLKLGKIRAAFAGLLSSRVSIRTPTAVCAVRGTVFELGSDEKGTEVTMAEGVLEVKDKQGKQAVVTSEETMRVGENGLERPHMLALNDNRSLRAVRPYAVHQEMFRDSTRKALEDFRNRELKSAQAQLGKDVVDAFGRRVRLEEYLIRPNVNSFEVLFLNSRQGSFNWGHLIESFNSAIPNDLSQVPAIVASAFLSPTQPSNWMKSFEFYATNTVDAEKELMTFGAPAQINFAGLNSGNTLNLWYPSSINFTQTLIGPGVPGGSRDQFFQHQDFGITNPGVFTWTQSVQPTAGVNTALVDGSGNAIAANIMYAAILNPSTGVNGIVSGYGPGNTLYDNTTVAPVIYPNGPNKADILVGTTYPDGSTLSVEKFLVNNDGSLLNFNSPTSAAFGQNGSYNLEVNIQSNLFQGRNIDVLIAPQILAQTTQNTTTPDQIKP